MTAVSTADTITFSLVGFVLLMGAIVVWRVTVHDKRIRRLRFGFFYEREREDDEDNEREEVPHD